MRILSRLRYLVAVPRSSRGVSPSSGASSHLAPAPIKRSKHSKVPAGSPSFKQGTEPTGGFPGRPQSAPSATVVADALRDEHCEPRQCSLSLGLASMLSRQTCTMFVLTPHLPFPFPAAIPPWRQGRPALSPTGDISQFSRIQGESWADRSEEEELIPMHRFRGGGKAQRARCSTRWKVAVDRPCDLFTFQIDTGQDQGPTVSQVSMIVGLHTACKIP